jgi:uncharacterized protein YutE (UPF0331/DUF86 family)
LCSAHVVSALGIRTPTTTGETFELLAEAGIVPNDLALRLRMAVGFRNIAIHNYERIDWQIVHRLCQRGPTDFEDFARIVADRSPL